tara:strand:- start:2705 stop:4063 length:1359 start_codon:yes stop_codon:yes gene_type:complete
MIKFVVFDFDGVFTDGKVYFDCQGNIQKYYNIKDGTGIKLLIEKNIEVGVISGYKDNISQRKILEHLNIKYISFNSISKLDILNKWCQYLNIKLEEVAYMGDDINDLEIINNVKFSGCPNDAIKEIINNVDFISQKKGGEGCIREFVDKIINNSQKLSIIYEIKKEFNYQINNFNLNEIIELSKIIKNIDGNIYFCGIGKSGNIAKHCCDLLKCISLPSFYLDILNSTHGDIGTLTNKDIILMFSNSGNTKELVDIIPLFKNIGIKIIGICCNQNSKFKELSYINIITPFKSEISGEINKIPTNSCMSHLIFSNILVSILKKNISLEQYKENHFAGNIGKNLLKVKDVLIKEYPKIILKDKININNILLEMTKYKIGCCFFVNNENNFIGIITDGDIRRLLLTNKLQDINIKNINKKYYSIEDDNKYLSEINYKSIFIPVLKNNKILGIFRI